MYINLLPGSVRMKIHLRGTLRRWTLVWSVAICSAVLLCGNEFRQLRTARADLALIESHCQNARSLQIEITNSEKKLGELAEQRQALELLQPADRALDIIGRLAQAAMPLEGKLQLQRLAFVAAARVIPVPAPTSPPPPRGQNHPVQRPEATVNLHGVAESDKVLARFAESLQATQVFERVELRASSQLQGGPNAARQFQIECRFEEVP